MIVIIDDGDVDLLGTVLGSSVASADGTNLNEDGFIAFGEVVIDRAQSRGSAEAASRNCQVVS